MCLPICFPVTIGSIGLRLSKRIIKKVQVQNSGNDRLDMKNKKDNFDTNVKFEKYELIVMGSDISFGLSGEFYYCTLNNKLEGLQCNFEEGTQEYNKLLNKCNELRTLTLEISHLISK